MLPNNSPLNIRNRHLVNIKPHRNFSLSESTAFTQFSYLNNLSPIQFCKMMIDSPILLIKTKFPSMFLIFLGRNPLKILRSIIQPIGIFMVHLSKTTWIRNIALGYKSMNQKFSRLFSVLIKHDHFIPMSNKPRFEKSTIFPSSFLGIRESPDFAVLLSSIYSLISDYIFHRFKVINPNSIILT